jgi:hypothetical protein
MDGRRLGEAGLKGWRGKVADSVAGPIAKRSSATSGQVRAVIGVVFIVLSLVYVVGTIRRIVAST